MSGGINVVYDATHSNIGSLPKNASYAGYVTGSGGVPWTEGDFSKFPDAIRIDQTPANTKWDETADIDDYERGAVQLNELAPRAKARQASYKSGKRPGQRMPGVYMSASDVTHVVNALISGGVKSGVGLWVANWNLTKTDGIGDVLTASGPFPIIGVQFHNAGAYDISVMSVDWLTNRSGKPVSTPTPSTGAKIPPGQWDTTGGRDWTWKDVATVGVGEDGKLHIFVFDAANNTWNKTK